MTLCILALILSSTRTVALILVAAFSKFSVQRMPFLFIEFVFNNYYYCIEIRKLILIIHAIQIHDVLLITDLL